MLHNSRTRHDDMIGCDRVGCLHSSAAIVCLEHGDLLRPSSLTLDSGTSRSCLRQLGSSLFSTYARGQEADVTRDAIHSHILVCSLFSPCWRQGPAHARTSRTNLSSQERQMSQRPEKITERRVRYQTADTEAWHTMIEPWLAIY